ncbi:MAG TPA: cation diffusion facilitator family transporter [Acidimicrobiales bacterium]
MGDDRHAHHHAKAQGLLARLGHAARSLVVPHSHDVADSVDDVLEGSREGVRAVVVSLVLLLGTAGVQLLVVALSGSIALFSDALHNGADALTAVPLYFAFRLSGRPPTRRFTYGLGKVEDLAGIVVVLVVAASAVVAAYSAIERLVHPQKISHLPVVVIAGLIGVVGNEVVAEYRTRVGRRIGSAALEADGEHARADGIASFLVVVGAIGVACGLDWADPAMGLLIALVILLVLVRTAVTIGQRLLDAVDPHLVERIVRSVGAVEGVEDVTEVQARWIGHRLYAQVRLSVPGSMSVTEAHAVAEAALHHLLHDVPKMSDAIVHVDPAGSNVHAHELTAHHRHP